MKTLLLIALFVTTSVFAGPREAYQEMLEGKAVFLDVRENDEVMAGMIKGAKWIPLTEMETSPTETITKVKEVAAGKNIYLYCRSGRRSQIFLDHMNRAGVSGKNLGGYQDLVKEGLPSL